MDIRQTKTYGAFLTGIGWKVKREKGTQIFFKKIPIIGSAMKIQRTDDFNIKDVLTLAKEHHVFQIIIEPKSDLHTKELSEHGFSLSKSTFLPSKTVQINLDQSLPSILSHMKKDARYSIKKSSSCVIKECTDTQTFRNAWRQAVAHRRHVLPMHDLDALRKAFGSDLIYLLNEDHTSGGMFLKADKTVYYWAGFTTQGARKTLVQYQVIWKAIKWAKEKRATTFDFEGIYDERFPKKDWLGFTHFKKSFGGEEVSFPGCYTKSRIPFF